MTPTFTVSRPSSLIDDVTAWDARRPRSEQVEIGLSELYDCEAAIGYKLDETWPSDDPDLWGAIRGTLLHDGIERIRKAAHPDHEFGTEVFYGRPGHVDEFVPAEHEVIDWKTSKLENIAVWLHDAESTIGKWAQVTGYAAGLIDKGLLDESLAVVSLICIPVDGKFADWVKLTMPFDRSIADVGLARVDDIAARRAAGEQLRRQKPYSWCSAWCEFFTLCRDPLPPESEEITDPELVAAIDLYGTVAEVASAADKEKKRVAPLIRGLRGTAKGWRISMTNPSGTKSVLDEDQVRADYAANQLSVPTVDVPSSSPSLRVTRLKETT